MPKISADPYILFLVTAAMVSDSSKIPTSVLCGILYGTFMSTSVLVSLDDKILYRNYITYNKTPKQVNNSNNGQQMFMNILPQTHKCDPIILNTITQWHNVCVGYPMEHSC